MVEEIEEVQTELDGRPLVEDGPVLIQRQVGVIEVRSSTNTTRRHVVGNRTQGIANQRKCSWIDDGVIVTACGAALAGEQWAQRIGITILDQSAALIQLTGKGGPGCGIDPEIVLVSSLKDSEVISVLRRDDGGELPSSDYARSNPLAPRSFGRYQMAFATNMLGRFTFEVP